MALTVSLLESSEYHEVHGASAASGENGDAELVIPPKFPYCTVQIQFAAGNNGTAALRAFFTDQVVDHGTDEGLPAVAGAVALVTQTYTVKRARRIVVTLASNDAAFRVYFVLHRA